MNPTILLAIISIIPATIASVCALISSIINGRQQARNHNETTGRMEEIRININGKVDELLALTQKSSYAEGKLKGEASKDTCKYPD